MELTDLDKQIIQDFLDGIMARNSAGNQLYIRDAVRIIENELENEKR